MMMEGPGKPDDQYLFLQVINPVRHPIRLWLTWLYFPLTLNFNLPEQDALEAMHRLSVKTL